jgi:acetyltransferase-like isoleucine patch superfamily enzyme
MKAISEVGFRKIAKFLLASAHVMMLGLMFLPPMRAAYLRLAGARIGKNTVLQPFRMYNIYRTGFRGLKMGDSCFISDDVLLDLADKIEMEDHVTLACRVNILTHTNVGYSDHPLQQYFPASSKGVRLCYGCFIGANALIMPGVTVGECSLVAAGSVVTRDVPPWSVVGGTPAKLIKSIKTPEDSGESAS